MMQQIDEAFEIYCKLAGQDPNTIWANLCFISYMRPQVWIMMRLCFVQDVHYSRSLEQKINDRAKDRVRNLLTPHAETLFKATLQKDGVFVRKYSLIKTVTGVGSFAFLSIVWDAMTEFWTYFKP